VRELSVVGVRVELPSNQPIVLLKEVDGDRYLPIWIGAVEATAIAYEQQGVKAPRPLTHDLMRDLLEELGRSTAVSDDLLDSALELDKVYISARYPDAHPSGSPRTRYTRKEAERMVAYADGIVRFCESSLSAT